VTSFFVAGGGVGSDFSVLGGSVFATEFSVSLTTVEVFFEAVPFLLELASFLQL